MNDTERPIEPQEPDHAEGTPSGGFSPRRRRLLRVASGAAPASLLLVGRPVHATTLSCLSTSAWGSMMVNPSASVTTRAIANGTKIQAWSLDQWCRNLEQVGIGRPWDKLCGSFDSKKFGSNFDGWKRTVLVSHFDVPRPSGLHTKDVLLFDLLNKTNNCAGLDDFPRHMVVACLNQRLLQGKGVDIDPTRCVPLLDVNLMASGSYTLPSGKYWGRAEILDYVKNNNVSRLF